MVFKNPFLDPLRQLIYIMSLWLQKKNLFLNPNVSGVHKKDTLNRQFSDPQIIKLSFKTSFKLDVVAPLIADPPR